MKITSLLLGSAAALVAVSGARAADAIIAEPEPVEYVRVCDAYGAGFYYIPGTETCLDISGYVRYNILVNKSGWNKEAKAYLSFDARSDTEYGTLRSFIAINGTYAGASTAATNGYINIDEAFIELGGLKIGLAYDYFDANGIGGENDSTPNARANMIAYNYASGNFKAGIAVVDDGNGDFTPNVEAMVGFSMSPVNVTVIGGYDNNTEEFTIEGVATATVTEGGTLGIDVTYGSGSTFAWSTSEWAVAGSYTQKVSDKVTVSVGAQYFANYLWGTTDYWTVGANVDWTPVTNFLVRANVQYNDRTSATTGYLRFQRSF